MPEALEGLRVVEVGSFTAGPYAGRQLANMGAEVIKIEPLEGEGVRNMGWQIQGDSVLYHINNSDKKDLSLNLNTPEAQEVVKRLVGQADVFIENFPAGTVYKWNLQYELIKEINPRLIYCSVNGFGQAGPYAERRAFDTVIQAMSGIMTLNGERDGMPLKIGLSASDLLGASFAVPAILAALHYRHRTGLGQHIDVSMHDITVWTTEDFWPLYLTGSEAARCGNRSVHEAPSNLYRARDGLVAVAVSNDHEWHGLLKAMGREDLSGDNRQANNQARLQNVEEADSIVASWVQHLTVEEVVSRCQANNVPASPFHECSDVAEHPHTLAREMLVERIHPLVGPMKLIGSPFKMSETPGSIHRTAPLLGQDNDLILADLGYSGEEISDLRTQKIIR